MIAGLEQQSVLPWLLHSCAHCLQWEHYLDSNDSVAVFQGLNVLKYDSGPKQDPNQKDFILVDPTHGYIVGIKTIKTFGKGQNIKKKLQQLHDTKDDLEKYFLSGILKEQWISNDWVFIPMVYCEEVLESIQICADCEKFMIIGKKFLIKLRHLVPDK